MIILIDTEKSTFMKGNMKKLLLLSALLIFACSSDEGYDNSNALSIVGRWNLTSVKYNGSYETLNSCDLESYLIFNQNVEIHEI